MSVLSNRVFGIPLWVFAVVGLVILGLLGVGIISAGYNLLTGEGWLEAIPCSEVDACRFWHPIVYSAIVILTVVTGFAYTTLLERKFIAWFQQRSGPNRVGPGGFLQPAADGVKLIFKEDIMPAGVYRGVYTIAPMLKAIPTLIVIAVIPLGTAITIPWFDGFWYTVPLGLASPNVGVLWLLAITSIGTYGVVLAGWASNNKYAMLGGLRASAQMISYELSFGLALVVPIMIASSMNVGEIIEAQSSIFSWFVFQNPLAAGILMIALLAEVNRAPFDLPEAEQELTAGYMTEYSGMKFALFMMAEYLGMIAVSLIAASMFFGGYKSGFGLEDGAPILGPIIMITKVIVLLIGMIWIRATLPRIRYDRLMSFGWKVMLPLSLLAVVWTAVALVIGDAFGTTGYGIISGIMFVLTVGAGALFLFRDDRTESPETDDYETDPIITGERNSIGWAILQIVGALIAIPFLLYDFLLKRLDGLAQMGDQPVTPQDTAIEEVRRD